MAGVPEGRATRRSLASSSRTASTITPSERNAAFALLAAAFALRVAALRAVGFDTDEPQHLHVAWGWSQGLVPYRDYFDNHTPLFQFLCAPLVRWIGERPDILIWMRVAMLPLYLGSLWAVYRIGRALRSERVALWGTAIAAVMPTFFLRSLEFRTDDLWAFLWLAILAVLVTGAMSRSRAMLAGLLAGAALCVSMKTVPLLIGLAGALLLAAATTRRARPPLAV
ncbi:MAG: glycosyltransferase family 39 protein, partial [Myxococcales bacterium]|nr:glycosyltransferase family 39 protein [Myxococcales bacterium]